MPWDFVAFMLLAAICVICAGGVVASANPVHSGIFLGICFINVAGIFVMLGAEFLAVVQVIVYTGAILVLLLFVLMLVDPDDVAGVPRAPSPVQRTVGCCSGWSCCLRSRSRFLAERSRAWPAMPPRRTSHSSAATRRRSAAPCTPNISCHSRLSRWC